MLAPTPNTIPEDKERLYPAVKTATVSEGWPVLNVEGVGEPFRLTLELVVALTSR